MAPFAPRIWAHFEGLRLKSTETLSRRTGTGHGMDMSIRTHPLAALVSGGLLLAAGCRTTTMPKTLTEQGPDPATAIPGATTGTLVVFTAPNTHADPISAPQRLTYSDYRLRSDSGMDLGTIKNHSDSVWEGPVALTLPRGRYQVTARANGLGIVVIPTRVVAGRTTTIHLDVTSPARP